MSEHAGYLNIFSKLPFSILALCIFVGGCGGTGGGSGGDASSSGPPDTTVPTATVMSPGEDMTGTATNGRLTATFSEAMVPAAINTDNFRLTDDGINFIPGSVSYDTTNKIAVFTPSNDLSPNTRYTATVITGIKDLSGNPLMTDFAWCFVTGGATDSDLPTVISTIPEDATPSVEINRRITATFSEEMNSSTLTSANFTLTGPGATPVSGTVRYLDRTTVFTPTHNFAPNTAYTAMITTGVRDLAGNAPQASVVWSFTTNAIADVNSPAIVSTNPANAESGAAISRTINATFSEPMNPVTITTANFTVTGPGDNPVIGTVAFDATSNTAIFTRINHLTTPVDFHITPVTNLDPSTTYTATLTTGVKDMAGNALASKLVWSFTTGP
jgi:hypothetical protein